MTAYEEWHLDQDGKGTEGPQDARPDRRAEAWRELAQAMRELRDDIEHSHDH